MSRKYKFRNPKGLYFISFATVYWIDLLIREEYREVILDSIIFCQNEKGLEVYGWCLMTSHVHMIVASNDKKLEEILRDLKRHTSGGLNRTSGTPAFIATARSSATPLSPSAYWAR